MAETVEKAKDEGIEGALRREREGECRSGRGGLTGKQKEKRAEQLLRGPAPPLPPPSSASSTEFSCWPLKTYTLPGTATFWNLFKEIINNRHKGLCARVFII